MRYNYYRMIKGGLLSSLILFCFWQGKLVMAQTETIQKGPAEMVFIKRCAGRFELELPLEMQLLTSGYGQPQFFIDIYHSNDKDERTGIIQGEDRIDQWLSYIETLRLEKEKYRPTTYVLRDLERQIKSTAFYSLDKYSDANHSFTSFFFKDFPEQQLGITIAGRANKYIPRNTPSAEITAIFQQRVQWMRQAIEAIEYQPWPHKQAGVCLPRDILIANLMPPKDATNSYHENYGMEYFNSKNSLFKILVNVYGKGEEQGLKDELSRHTGMMAFFASSKTKVAGRDGRLFISDGKYSETQRQFRWVSTDTKINSVQYAHIEISGKIEIKDFPQMAPLNATDMIVGLLKGVRVRENGMLGVTE